MHGIQQITSQRKFLLTRPYGRDRDTRCGYQRENWFLLTRPYGRDQLELDKLNSVYSFYSHAHTGVITRPCLFLK